jgi:hypothetical protein
MLTETIGPCTLILADCREAMAAMAADSVHACVTDPPYELGFMGKAWDKANGVASDPATWEAVRRVLTPGGHVTAFAGSRTYHRIAMGIERGGFDVPSARWRKTARAVRWRWRCRQPITNSYKFGRRVPPRHAAPAAPRTGYRRRWCGASAIAENFRSSARCDPCRQHRHGRRHASTFAPIIDIRTAYRRVSQEPA